MTKKIIMLFGMNIIIVTGIFIAIALLIYGVMVMKSVIGIPLTIFVCAVVVCAFIVTLFQIYKLED